RLQVACRDLRPAQPDLFLYRERRHDVDGIRPAAQHIDQDRASSAVVEALAAYRRLADLHILTCKSDTVTAPDEARDLGLAARADVDSQVGHFHHVLVASLVDRLPQHDAGDGVIADLDAQAGDDAVVDAAHRQEADQAAVVPAGDHEPDLVHVRVEHHAQIF